MPQIIGYKIEKSSNFFDIYKDKLINGFAYFVASAAAYPETPIDALKAYCCTKSQVLIAAFDSKEYKKTTFNVENKVPEVKVLCKLHKFFRRERYRTMGSQIPIGRPKLLRKYRKHSRKIRALK